MVNLWQQLNDDMAGLVDKTRLSLVQISNGRRGSGAGTIWHADGLIITNAHVVHRHDHGLKVTLPDGRTLPARVLAADPTCDLAALSVQASGLPAIELGESRQLRPGQWVLAMGHPWGVAGAVTAGTVIAVGPPRKCRPSMGPDPGGLTFTAGPLRRPLVDEAGRLVGINTMIAGPTWAWLSPCTWLKIS